MEETILRISRTITLYSEIAEKQKDIIDELYSLLLQYVEVSELEALTDDIKKAAELMREVEEC